MSGWNKTFYNSFKLNWNLSLSLKLRERNWLQKFISFLLTQRFCLQIYILSHLLLFLQYGCQPVKVLTNVVNAYSPHTGTYEYAERKCTVWPLWYNNAKTLFYQEFSKHQRDVYHFPASTSDNSNNSFSVWLMKNAQQVIALSDNPKGDNESANRAVNLFLEQGDEIYLKL